VVVSGCLFATTGVVLLHTNDLVLISYWAVGVFVIVTCLGLFVRGHSYAHLPMASGKVLAIIPAYNEEQAALDATVWSLINQTHPPDLIVVIDDGSVNPVHGFEHPLVDWRRQDNTGKRGAQCTVLKTFDRDEFAFIMTVDSDSTPYPDALEHLLRAMSDPKVEATTGMIYIRNFADTWVSRAADMDIGMSCVMMRASRSALGCLETTSGALAVYRSSLLYDHLDAYAVECGTGDDRWLALRALQRGQVVGVFEAGVETDMPTTMKGTFRQRLRWARSWWWMIPYVFTRLGNKQILSPSFGLIQLIATPAMLCWIVAATIFNHTQGHDRSMSVTLIYIASYLVVRYCTAALYLVGRSNLTRRQKLGQWLLGTPASVWLNLVLLMPTRYYALFKLFDNRWQTREVAPLEAATAG
jgi:cellulose synthase/poly-beta-1,6-N-acetylglucosamine synthase-like glycosyltransferase